jgi:hypothetical protein
MGNAVQSGVGEMEGKEDNDRFTWMSEESKKLTALIAVPDDTIIDIYLADTDWEFIRKMDALLESAVKMVVKTNLTGSDRMDKGRIEAFIDSLPMRGRTSLLTLLKAAGCAKEELDLIDCIRRLRTALRMISCKSSRLLSKLSRSEVINRYSFGGYRTCTNTRRQS